MDHPQRRVTSWSSAAALAVATLLSIGTARAQNPNQFGGQDRANAASQLVLFGVDRGIAALPAVSGPSVTYQFDPASDAFVRATRLGSTVLPSTQTIGQGSLTVQVAASYFEQSESFTPINYLFTRDDLPTEPIVAKVGLDVRARVTLINLAATYGLTQRIQLGLSLPITVVDAQAQQVFSTRRSLLNLPPPQAVISGARVQNGDVAAAVRTLNESLGPGKPLALRGDTFSALGFDFNDGTHAGVGRIALGGKGLVYSYQRLQFAAAGDVLLPSPSQAEFAGPDSVAIYPRVIASLRPADAITLSTDLGYSYDFDHAELQRFAWTIGGSFGSERFSLDVGFAGSEYAQSIEWTPAVVHGEPRTTGVALNDASTGTTLVSAVFGGKLRVAEATVLAGGLSVPIVNLAFQPDVLGTLAVEYTF
ncbi:transporter [bacterium]|nr:transporter [bacterium]